MEKGEKDFATSIEHDELFRDKEEEDKEVRVAEMVKGCFDIPEVSIDDDGDDNEGEEREKVRPEGGACLFFLSHEEIIAQVV